MGKRHKNSKINWRKRVHEQKSVYEQNEYVKSLNNIPDPLLSTQPEKGIDKSRSNYSLSEAEEDDISAPIKPRKRRNRSLKSQATSFLNTNFGSAMVSGLLIMIFTLLFTMIFALNTQVNNLDSEIKSRLSSIEKQLEFSKDDLQDVNRYYTELSIIKSDYLKGSDLDNIKERLVTLEVQLNK